MNSPRNTIGLILWLFLCFAASGNIAVFAVDQSTGGLKFTGKSTPVGNPSMILFLDLNQPE